MIGLDWFFFTKHAIMAVQKSQASNYAQCSGLNQKEKGIKVKKK
jgi:hypothetical protein